MGINMGYCPLTDDDDDGEAIKDFVYVVVVDSQRLGTIAGEQLRRFRTKSQRCTFLFIDSRVLLLHLVVGSSL